MSLTRLLNPTGGFMRGLDAYGDGAFGAERKRGDEVYKHMGVDICAKPAQDIWCPCDGVVTRTGLAYADDTRFHSIHIQPDADLMADLKLLYVTPASFSVPRAVRRGDVLGVSEDLGQRYQGITNHCHVELHISGELVDPTPLIFGDTAA